MCIRDRIIGAALSYVLMYQLDFFTPFVDALYAVIMDADTVWVILDVYKRQVSSIQENFM